MKVARTSSLEGTVDLAVSDALARARAAWPTIPLDEPDIRETFGEEVSARLDAAPETESAIKANACESAARLSSVRAATATRCTSSSRAT